jgi:hypothetical protein
MKGVKIGKREVGFGVWSLEFGVDVRSCHAGVDEGGL